jgi:hypothetical protein
VNFEVFASNCRVFLYGWYPLFVKLSKVGNEIKYSTASVVLLIESGKVSEDTIIIMTMHYIGYGMVPDRSKRK